MSLESDGIWKGGLWSGDVWAEGVWRIGVSTSIPVFGLTSTITAVSLESTLAPAIELESDIT